MALNSLDLRDMPMAMGSLRMSELSQVMSSQEVQEMMAWLPGLMAAPEDSLPLLDSLPLDSLPLEVRGHPITPANSRCAWCGAVHGVACLGVHVRGRT